MPEQRYCPNCGTHIPPNARFCDQCGTPLQGNFPPTGQPPTSLPVPSLLPDPIHYPGPNATIPPPLTQPPPYNVLTTPPTKLNATDIVRTSISIYTQKFLGFFLAILFFILIGNLLSSFILPFQDQVVLLFAGELPNLELFLLTLEITTPILVYLLVSFIFSILLSVVSIFLSSLGNAIIVQNTVNLYQNQPSDWGASFQVVRRNFGTLVKGSIIFSLAVSLGTFLFLIPGVYLITIWAVWQQIVVIENSNASEALQRSSYLTKGHRFKIFLVMFLLVVIEGLIGIVILFFAPEILYTSFSGILGVIVDSLIVAILTPLTPIAGTVIYLQLTKEKEPSSEFNAHSNMVL